MTFIYMLNILKVLVGAGTTHGGFQIQPFTLIHGGNNGIIRADLLHGTPVYTTVITENGAGLRSVFHAKAVTIDKTVPVITNVTTVVTETRNSSLNDFSSMSVVTTWAVNDPESKVKACYCALGRKT